MFVFRKKTHAILTGNGRDVIKADAVDGVRFCCINYRTEIDRDESVQFQDSHKCRLRDFNCSDLTHTFFSLFLFFKQFAFT